MRRSRRKKDQKSQKVNYKKTAQIFISPYKLHNIVKWVKDMHKSFINDLQEIYKNTEVGKEQIKNLLEKQSKFTKQFTKSIDAILKQELELEAIDDRTREYLITYTADTREKLKDANSRIEKEIIRKRVTT